MLNGKYNRACVIIPTYNEVDNIEQLIHDIAAVAVGINIIVVDDNSPDGTSAVVSSLQKCYPHLYLISRSGKAGRGGAVIEGIRRAMNLKADYILEMDADFSHDPKDIIRFLDIIQDGYDVVVGSKHLRNSKIVGWDWKRKYLSLCGNLFARLMLGVPLCDYTNGFRCYTRKSLEAINFEQVHATGYVVLSEMIYQLHHLGYRIKEVPIVFVNRRRGLSNLTLAEVTGAFKTIVAIKKKEILTRFHEIFKH